MITVNEARAALERLLDRAGAIHEYYVLEEFIKQYEDWVKVKKVSALLKGKEEE